MDNVLSPLGEKIINYLWDYEDGNETNSCHTDYNSIQSDQQAIDALCEITDDIYELDDYFTEKELDTIATLQYLN